MTHMDLISRAWLKEAIHNFFNGLSHKVTEEDIQVYVEVAPSAFEGMTNNEVHKAIFGFKLDPRYLVTGDHCIVGGEDCPSCPLYNKICNNRNFAEWLDSPYKGVSK